MIPKVKSLFLYFLWNESIVNFWISLFNYFSYITKEILILSICVFWNIEYIYLFLFLFITFKNFIMDKEGGPSQTDC